jgi:hypothetical protein
MYSEISAIPPAIETIIGLAAIFFFRGIMLFFAIGFAIFLRL